MKKIHLWQEKLKLDETTVTAAVTIEFPDGQKQQLWYKLPLKYQEVIPSHCNSFVLATLFLAMDYPAELVVHGEVDRQLLRNLEEFQIAWAAWCPRYQPIEIIVDREVETSNTSSHNQANNQAIMPFSGGVDSCFTLGRHTKFNIGRQRQNLQAGLMVHGFDIPLEQPEVFAKALARSQVILDSVGVELIPIATNFRELKQNWEDAHGVGLISCLMFLENIYPIGLISGGMTYDTLDLPYGSNPLTDPYLSSSSFEVIYDGAAYSRVGKIQAIQNWQEVRDHLRVCWQGAELDKNCCKCEKCIRNILSFRVVGAGLPSCFAEDVEESQITALEISEVQLKEFPAIFSTAKARRLNDEPWVRSLESCVRRHERRYAIKAVKIFLRQQIPMSIKKPLWRIRRRLIGR